MQLYSHIATTLSLLRVIGIAQRDSLRVKVKERIRTSQERITKGPVLSIAIAPVDRRPTRIGSVLCDQTLDGNLNLEPVLVKAKYQCGIIFGSSSKRAVYLGIAAATVNLEVLRDKPPDGSR